MPIELTLISKPGCHLCEVAREQLATAILDWQQRNPGSTVTVAERSILDDEKLAALYSEEIPVLLINGEQVSFWKIDENRVFDRLRSLTQS